MNDEQIEAEIQAKGKTAARVLPTDVESNIVQECYFTVGEAMQAIRGVSVDDGPLELLTICVLVLENGFTVTGESACASPENFDADIGRSIARANAVQKVWPLMGYALRGQLSKQETLA